LQKFQFFSCSTFRGGRIAKMKFNYPTTTTKSNLLESGCHISEACIVEVFPSSVCYLRSNLHSD
jgi:hypothetical protein